MFRRKRIITVVVIGVISVLYFKFGITPPRKLTIEQILKLNSLHYLDCLGKEVEGYMKENKGQKPQHLACLLPTNCTYNIEKIFRVPQSKKLGNKERLERDPLLLDVDCDYVLPANPSSRILIHERPGLWADNSVAAYIMGRGSLRLSCDEFKRRLCLVGTDEDIKASP